MGMYPSADLSYGIDLGDEFYADPEDGRDHEELTWLTWELWEKSWEWETASATYLKSRGINGVHLTNYGHPDYPQWALATRVIGCCGWGDLRIVKTEDMTVTDDDELLRQAWAILFPSREAGPIAWRLSATFG